MSAARAATTGIASAFGALLGALIGGEIGETVTINGPKNVRRSDVAHARMTGAVTGGTIGALVVGAIAGASSASELPARTS